MTREERRKRFVPPRLLSSVLGQRRETGKYADRGSRGGRREEMIEMDTVIVIVAFLAFSSFCLWWLVRCR
jgi:hypothetical protein